MCKLFIHVAILTFIGIRGTLAFLISPQSSTTSAGSLKMSSPTESNAQAQEGGLLLSKLHKLTTDGPQRLVLASQSPRRREILDMMGLSNRYTVTFSPLDEEALQIELAKTPISPQDYAKKLAESKAHALADHMVSSDEVYSHESSLILGSDTIVDKDSNILEKPKNEEDAKRMLRELSGDWHEVHTGVALYKIHHGNDNLIELISSFTETAKVKFSTLTSEDINAYVETGEPMDKAGSYGIQGIGGQMVERMDGDFFAVMGLPMFRLSGELARAI